MTSYNISLLSIAEQRDIELNRQAALLIHNFKRGQISRQRIEVEILKLDENEQVKFKEFLNKYKENPKQKLNEKNKHRNDGSAKTKAWLKNIKGKLNNGK